MRKVLAAVAALAMVAALSTSALADSENWDAEKAEQVDINRSTNAGIGNGGENWKSLGNTTAPNKNGEDSATTGDNDPGNSEENNNAAANE